MNMTGYSHISLIEANHALLMGCYQVHNDKM